MKDFFKIVGFILAIVLVVPFIILVVFYFSDNEFADQLKSSKSEVKDRVRKEAKKINRQVKKTVETKVDEIKSKLSERQLEIFNYIQTKAEAEMSNLSEKFKDVTPRTLRRDLAKLVQEGLIEKSGSTKNSSYKSK